MNKQEVIDLMKTSTSDAEWRKNCDIVKEKCNGYPDFWFETIIKSGLGNEITAKFGSDLNFHIITF